MNLQVTTFRGEPRIDSRLIAMDLGNNHKSTIELIEKYCAGTHRAKGSHYQMTFIRREPDAPYTNETYRKASAERRGEAYVPIA